MSPLKCQKSTIGLLVLSGALVIAVVALTAVLVMYDELFRKDDASGKDPSTGGWVDDYRIPPDTVPLHYELYLNPIMETGIFHGKVFIHVHIKEKRDYIVVHVKNLVIGKSALYKDLLTMEDPQVEPSAAPIANTQSFEYPQNEFLVMTAGGGFEPGSYTWYLVFSGSLTDSIVGFYRTVYTTAAGEQRLMATSKFQPTYARRAFPCFDEPSFKSTFRVMLVRPTGNNYTALSNMNIEKEVRDQPKEGLTTVHFNTSVKMVTYLACFIVCDFEYKESLTDDGVKFRVYARPEQIEATTYAVNLGTNISNYFVNYFGVKYPLPKQDMIAIPDFVSGAMEHWGLITFRETNLLYNEATSSAANKQRVATVISHELAHMWFGNLVTLKWWDDLWLNEGFASYMEFKGVAPYEQSWDIQTQFISSDLAPVMDLDAQLSSHPIVQEVHHPDEITQLFDIISYNKGASVLRMLEDFLSGPVFEAGVSSFLKEYEFANAVTQDLWDSLQGVWTDNNGLNVGRVMDTWTKQMGYPVVSVRKLGQGKYELTQKRFLADPEAVAPDDSPFHYKWDIPISYRYWDGNTMKDGPRAWLTRENEKLELDSVGSLPIKINNDYKGYFLVNYDEDTWNFFASQLANDTMRKQMSAADRANLVEDAFKLASARQLPYSVPLQLSVSLNLETHAVPWDVAYDGLEKIRLLLKSAGGEVDLKYNDFLRNISAPLFDDGYDFTDLGNDDVLRVQLQTRVIQLACDSGHEPCLKAARSLFEGWLSPESVALAPNLKGLVFKYGMTNETGSGANWDIMFQRYLKEGDAQSKNAYMIGLASSPNVTQLEIYIQKAKDQNFVRRQDFFTVISSISRNPAGNSLAWDFYRNEWESWLVPTFTLNDRYLGNLVKTLTSSFSSTERKKEMEDFFEKYPEAGAGTAARKDALEAVQNNINWLLRSAKEVEAWLNSKDYPYQT